MTRLIDADALKKAIDDYAEKRQDTLLWQADIDELIDNAPTVETPTIYEFKGCDNCELERPKGEWIFQYTFLDDNLYKCSSCDRLLSIDVEQDIEQFLFCPNCGADMRKGENNERL